MSVQEPAVANLPLQLTSFVGRQHELAEARQLLAGTRLLTLTGPGGSGKTRLAIELASAVAADFPDGVYFAPLAPISDPALLLASIAQAIGLHDAHEGSLIDYLVRHLRQQTTLLVLDNFEHLLAAATLVTELLRNTLAVKVVATSRACLRVSGEQEFPVPPLGLPDLDPTASVEASTVLAAESVKLFVERARAALPTFKLENANAACLAQIAARLDGLPLALELAATRIKVLSPQAMLPRLEHSLGLLVAGPRDLPDRQRTLRATIAWSHDLLGPGAQRLLAACSVFRGGASLESIESIGQVIGLGGEQSVLASLEELLDQNLVRRLEGQTGLRLAMLETIREFAAERLAELPVADLVRQSHAAEFLRLAEEAKRRLTGPDEKKWLHLVEVEHNNIRAALDHYARTSPGTALRLAVAMRPFWSARGHFSEGRQRLRMLLERVPERTLTRVRALHAAAWLAVDQGGYDEAASMLHESIRLSGEIGDVLGEGLSLAHLGRCKIAAGHPSEGAPHLDRALPILRATADPPDIAVGLVYWGLVAIFTAEPGVASERLVEGVEMCRRIGFRSLGARALYLLSVARIEIGDLAGARSDLEEALPVSLELGDYWIIAQQMGAFGALAAKSGRAREALRLAGFQGAWSRAHEFSVPAVIRAKLESWLVPARQAVGPLASGLTAEGGQFTIDQAVAVALHRASSPGIRSTLTPREVEVARLVAAGRSNREIASELTLSVRTVEVHVDHILTKLDLSSRTQLAAWVYRSADNAD